MTIEVTNFKARALRLISIANDLLSVARQIEHDDANSSLLVLDDQHDVANSFALPQSDDLLWADLAREQYRSRRRRDKIFGSHTLFGEPAWDILLDLFVATKENRKVSVMSACIGAAVPSTTALRWIAALEREGLLTRRDDPGDARRTYVLLTPKGYDAMVQYFEAATRTLKPSTLAKLTSQADRRHDPSIISSGPVDHTILEQRRA